MKTVLHHFIDAVEANPNGLLFQSQVEAYTYLDVAMRVGAGIAQFNELEIRNGDRILCFTDRTIPLSHFLLTAGFLQVVPAALSPVFSMEYLRSLVRQSAAQAILTTPSIARAAEAADCGIPVVSYIAPRSYARSEPPPPSVHHFANRAQTDARKTLHTLRELADQRRLEDPFLIQPTSGSTGIPKLVVRNHYAFSRYAEFVGNEVAKMFPSGGFRMLAVNALTHAFAGHMFTLGLRFGATIVVPSEIDANASLDEVRALDMDVLPMTPRVLRSFVRQQQAKNEPPGTRLFGPSAKLLLSAGGRADPHTFRRLQNEGIEVLEFYGSSEASIVACTPAHGWREGRAGRPVADVETKFSRQGELLLHSPGLMNGYYGDSEMTHLVFDEDGFYRTGDLARIDEQGYLEVFGRRRDVFGTPEGSNIYPERLENLLESQESVEQAFLFGDGLPFLTAHLVIQPEMLLGGRIGGHRHELVEGGKGHNGFMSPEENEEAYKVVGELIAGLNRGLELIEQVVAFALYDARFSEECYQLVTGKVRRVRPRFGEVYAPTTELLYSNLEKDSLMLVPPRERRYRYRMGAVMQAILEPEASMEIDLSARPPSKVKA